MTEDEHLRKIALSLALRNASFDTNSDEIVRAAETFLKFLHAEVQKDPLG